MLCQRYYLHHMVLTFLQIVVIYYIIKMNLYKKNEFVSNRILETINILINRKMFVYNVGDGRIIIFLSFELKYYLGVFG